MRGTSVFPPSSTGLILIFLLSLVRSCCGYQYIVSTYTGDSFGAGTDARVFIQLFGDKGESPDIELTANGRDLFERNQIDTFAVTTKDLGRLNRIIIHHDNSWLGPGWYLDKVTITTEEGDYYEFPCHRWLDQDIDDGQTSRELRSQPSKRDNLEKEPRQPLGCSLPLGMFSEKISDSQISASTSFNDVHLPYHGRLNRVVDGSLGGWCPYSDRLDEYIQITLPGKKAITGIATQGMALVDEWTTGYKLSYSNRSDSGWIFYADSEEPKVFVGNNDQNSTVEHWVRRPFTAQHVRVFPVDWHGKGCLRLELYGCDVTELYPDESSSDNNPPPSTVLSSEIIHEDDQGSTRSAVVQKSQRVGDADVDGIDAIPVVHLDFDQIKGNLITDSSGHHNDAHMRKPADVVTFSKRCQRGLRLNGGDVVFDGEYFLDKPKEAVTILAWIKLFSNGGQHSIFDTAGGKYSSHHEGQYHFEVERGRLRWFHRNEGGETVFNISTGLLVPAHVWTHVAATYNSISGHVAVFVSGKLASQGYGIGELSQDWTGHAGIGRHKNARVLNGEIDEFYIFNKALVPSKIEMLMKRCSFELDCQQPLGMQSKAIPDAQITASSTYNLHKPFYGRINLASFWGDPARTAWCAVKEDKNPYLEIDLGEMKSITGVSTQGLSIFDNWVTAFLFCYSKDRSTWLCYKDRGYDKIFDGNSDKNTVKRHYFHHSVNGRYVRIQPQSWYGNHLCLRTEVHGCTMDLFPDPFDSFGNIPNLMEETESSARAGVAPSGFETCSNPLGVANGEIDDLHMAASSELDELHSARFSRLVRSTMVSENVHGCWCSKDVNLRQYLEADLGEVKVVTGVATQGYVSRENWVTSYRIGYSVDSGPLSWYTDSGEEKIFDGNTDHGGIIRQYLKHPIRTRYIRINPRSWHGQHICTRVEFFGCYNDPSVPTGDLAASHHETPISDKQKDPVEPTHVRPQGTLPPGFQPLAENTKASINASQTEAVLAHLNSVAQALLLSKLNATLGSSRKLVPNLSPTPSKVSQAIQPLNHVAPSVLLHQAHPGSAEANSSNTLSSAPVHLQTQTSPTNSDKIAEKFVNLIHRFPELSRHGVTPALLSRLSLKVPNMEKKIEAYFESKPDQLPVSYQQNPLQHNLSLSQLAFFKRLHQALTPTLSAVQSRGSASLNASLDSGNQSNGTTWGFPGKQRVEGEPVNGTRKQYISSYETLAPLFTFDVGDLNQYPWSSFSACSSTCGKGVQKRHRKCGVPHCPSEGVQIETIPCLQSLCADQHPYGSEWSHYSSCDAPCGTGKSVRYRVCSGMNCAPPGYETEVVSCFKPKCPVCIINFEQVEGNVVLDASGLGNNAFIDGKVVIVPHESSCGHYVDLTGGGQLLLVDKTFRSKPSSAISIVCWIHLKSNISSKHSVFTTERMYEPGKFIGGYHLELVGGKIRWAHRTSGLDTLYDLVTSTSVVIPYVWHYLAATYDSATGASKIYLDAKEVASSVGRRELLSQDWGFRAIIGNYDFDSRHFDGMIDDFFIYGYSLTQEQLLELIGRPSCPKPTPKNDIANLLLSAGGVQPVPHPTNWADTRWRYRREQDAA